ncbi:tetratricopeptide repeat protein [Marinicella meishanensis]|uniref:tetratricopeptide repeat protein n=1 Tax=Marinicella meishanensis TaxID=2873263 RepID=UPI001CBAFEB1|nr:hypothetical protein [Marinicella sp. NBU2979]
MIWTPTLTAHLDADHHLDYLNERIEQHPNDPSLFLQRAQILAVHGAWQQAASDLHTASRGFAFAPDIHLHMGLLYAEQQHAVLATQYLTQFLSSEGVAQFPNKQALAAVTLAELASQQQRPAVAAQHYLQVLQWQRKAPAHLYLITAQTLQQSRDRESAMAVITQGLASYPAHLGLLELNIKLAQQSGNQAQAQAALDRLLHRFPNHPKWQTTPDAPHAAQ